MGSESPQVFKINQDFTNQRDELILMLHNYEKYVKPRQKTLDELCEYFLQGEAIITYAAIFRSPLKNSLPTNTTDMTILHHQFLVFATNQSKYYSMEKNTSIVLIQESKKYEQVTQRLAGKHRVYCEEQQRPLLSSVHKQQSGLSYPLINLIIELSKPESLLKKYNLFFNNCKDFAGYFYDIITKKK